MIEVLKFGGSALLEKDKWDEDEHPRDDTGRFSESGGGGGGDRDRESGGERHEGDPVQARTIKEAIELLGDGQGIEFERPEQVVTMLHKIRKIVKKAKKAGEKAKVYDLCKVYVAGTNMFCRENVNIPRSEMPQLKGFPLPNSRASSMLKDDKGRVDLTKQYLDHLEKVGVFHENLKINASHIRASQTQIDGAKVAKILKEYEKEGIPERNFLISKDHYVIDGHHHWAAQIALALDRGKKVKMQVTRIDEKILPVLARTKKYVDRMGIPSREVGKMLEWADDEDYEEDCIACGDKDYNEAVHQEIEEWPNKETANEDQEGDHRAGESD